MFTYCLNNPTHYNDARGLAATNFTTVVNDSSSDPNFIPDRTEEFFDLLANNAKQIQVWIDEYGWFGAFKRFYQKVDHGGDWDYKVTSLGWAPDDGKFLVAGEVMDIHQLGNINYGFVGAALGLHDTMIYAGGGFAASYKDGSLNIHWENWASLFDDPDDFVMVYLGIVLYSNYSNGYWGGRSICTLDFSI